jgi:hypothetical protein
MSSLFRLMKQLLVRCLNYESEIFLKKNHNYSFRIFYALTFLVISSAASGQISFTYQSGYKFLKGKDASSISTGWMNPAFDDAAWISGNAPFRYGDGISGTELTDMQNNYSTIYLRSSFVCSNKALLNKLMFSVDYDDGFVLWINGTEVLRRNAPLNLAFNSLAPLNHESGTGEDISADASSINLSEGTNIIAVQCFNVNLTSTDFYFDIAISAEKDIPEVQDSTGIGYSVKAGFFSNPFSVTLISPDPSASIVYTLDGSNPQNSQNSFVADSPVSVQIDPVSTAGRPATPAVIIRASLYKTGYKPSKPSARTYIFTEKVKSQTWPGGEWPKTDINGQIIDLAMDTRVVSSPAYSSRFNNSLLDVPTVSVVTDIKNLFDPVTGIYVNADGHGVNWEKECSVELIRNDGTEGFSINAGLRIRGGWSRHDTYPKHSFRLFFRGVYGSEKLNYPLFGDEGVSEFDKVDLRTEQNYAWCNGLINNSLVRDVFSRDTQREMGQPYTRSRYYHLYLNGMYWGMYQTQERSEARYASSYLGGNVEDYDVVKVNTENWGHVIEATDGTLDSWQKIYNLCTTGFASNADYYAIEGRDAEGKPVKGKEVLVDVDNLIDYMLVIFYTGNFDAPTSSFSKNKGANNFYAIENREDKSSGYKFFAHDSEHSLFDEAHSPGIGIWEDRVNLGIRQDDMKMVISSFSGFNPQWLHFKLTSNSDYRARFADRAYKYFQKGGVFSYESGLVRINKRIEEVDLAVIAESARWGDAKRGTAASYTRNDQWLPEVNKIRNNFLRYRPDIVIPQLRVAGLYPAINAPLFSTSSGEITSKEIPLTSPLKINILNPNSSGTIYYTISGADPRKAGGDVYPGAIFCNSDAKVSISSSSVIKARIYDNGVWSALSEVNFLKEDEDYSGLKITELHYHPAEYIVGTDTTDGKDLEFIEFKNTGIHAINLSGLELDSAVQYHFPANALLPPKQFFVVASKPSHFYDYYGLIASGNFQGNFSNSGEEVILRDARGNTLIDFIYGDSSPWPGKADGDGFSLSAAEINPSGDPADYRYWIHSDVIGGTPFANNSVINSEITGSDSADSLLVYPNPTKGMINIYLLSENEPGQVKMELFNMTGRVVYSTFTGNGAMLNLKQLGLASGMYILKVTSEKSELRQRIMLIK